MKNGYILALINPVAGSVAENDALQETLRREAGLRGRSLKIHETRADEDSAAVVRAACADGASLVIAAGGDGTVGAAVNGMIGTGVPLGIIPVGTGNGVAHATGIPLRRDAAIQLILEEAQQQRITVDALRVADRHFILNVSCGISARSIRDTRRKDKRRFGLLAYVWVIAGHVLGFRSHRYHLVLDGRTIEVEATEILVSNGTIMEALPALIGPRETFCDGILDVYVINGRSIPEYLEIGFRLLFRLRRDDRKITHHQVRDHVSIHAHRRSQPVQGDGDPLGRTPVEVKMVRGGCTLIVPGEAR